uniref:Glycoprotein n=1 Tax=Rhabditophanes sp. KR3021 TaxID=114890 RepID=A0AC35TJF1_9BILA
MVTVFIPQLFCSDVKNYQIKEESLYNDGKESVYTFIQPIRRLYPFSPLGSFTYKSMIKSFAMYGPLLYDTDLTSSIKNQIRAREYNTKCCFDMYDRTAYQTLKGVGCGKYHIKLFQNDDDGTICGINSRCCHSGDKNNILLPTNVLDYPINVICNKPNFTNSVDEESNCLGLTIIIDNRPCTYEIHGHCHLMNEHKCLWMNGIFHGEAHLCSQVDGISDLTLAGISNSEFILFSLYTRIIMSSISVETIISFVITFFGILHGVVRFEQYNTTIVSAVSY